MSGGESARERVTHVHGHARANAGPSARRRQWTMRTVAHTRVRSVREWVCEANALDFSRGGTKPSREAQNPVMGTINLAVGGYKPSRMWL